MIYKESQTVELKSSLSDWHDIVISLAAFANTKGGTVVVGLDDNGIPTDLKIGNRTLEDLAQKIKQNTDPILYTSIAVKDFGRKCLIEVELAIMRTGEARRYALTYRRMLRLFL